MAGLQANLIIIDVANFEVGFFLLFQDVLLPNYPGSYIGWDKFQNLVRMIEIRIALNIIRPTNVHPEIWRTSQMLEEKFINLDQF